MGEGLPIVICVKDSESLECFVVIGVRGVEIFDDQILSTPVGLECLIYGTSEALQRKMIRN